MHRPCGMLSSAAVNSRFCRRRRWITNAPAALSPSKVSITLSAAQGGSPGTKDSRWESAAVEVLAAPVGRVVRHDAVVKVAAIAYQRIDVLRQQESFADDNGCGRAHLLFIRGAIGIARCERRARIAGGAPLRFGARE